MTKGIPNDVKLSEPTKLRVYESEVPIVREIARRADLDEVAVKRRALHVGLVELANDLGIELPRAKKSKRDTQKLVAA